jgi:colicin import membrane protein
MSMTIASLNMKILALEARVEALEAKPAKAPKAEKKPKNPDAPKREANWFIKAMGPIREALKPLFEAHNAALPEGVKKLNGADAPRVGRILNEAGQMSKELQPSADEIKEAFELMLTGAAGVPKGPAQREAKARRDSAKSSVASDGSGAKAGKPKAELSEEEAAAKRAAKAAKAAATRAANKAKKAEAEAEKPAVEAEVVNDTAEVIHTEEVEMDIGKGLKTYERIVYGGVTYIYTADGDNFLGTWDEAKKVLNKNGKDIKNM